MDFHLLFQRAVTNFFILLCVFIAGFGAGTSHGSEFEKLSNQHVGKTVLLRGFYAGTDLKFDSFGALIGTAEREAWTVALIEVTDITAKSDRIVVKGKRMAMEAREDGTLVPVYRGDRDVKSGKISNIEKVRIAIEVRDKKDRVSALRKVLVLDREEWKTAVPAYWRPYLNGTLRKNLTPDAEGVAVVLDDGTKVYKAGGAVIAPKRIDTPDAEYTEPARKAHYIAKATLQAIVGIDGEVRDIEVQKPAGFGLDDNGVAAMQRWKFHPAMKDGRPVCAVINVEMGWSLY